MNTVVIVQSMNSQKGVVEDMAEGGENFYLQECVVGS